MKMKSCELCKYPARIYCDWDQASLCWTCDKKVYSANFLVARHSRSILCRVCQSPTPWTSSDEKLVPPAVSVCEKCTSEKEDGGTEESHGEIEEDDGDENEVEEEDLQVVPLCTTPPPAARSCSSDAFSNGGGGLMMKRKRDVADEDDVDCISLRKDRRGATFYEFLPPNSEEIAGDAFMSAVVGVDLN